MPNWKALVEAATPVEEDEDPVSFGPPASAAEIADAEESLGIALPADLKAFLLEANGSEDHCGWLVFDLETMVEENLDARELLTDSPNPPSLEKVVFFSDAMGDGDLFGICAAPVQTFKANEIVLFDHESGELRPFARNLEAYFRRETDDE